MGKNLKGKNVGKGICQRKDGLYQAKIYIKNNPKPIYLYDTNLNSLRNKKRNYEQFKAQPCFSERFTMTLEEWFERWMSSVCAKRLKNTTIRNYYSGYNRIKALGQMNLVDLDLHMIQVTINELSKKYKKATVESSLRTLTSCLEYAVKNNVLPYNPCYGVIVTEQVNMFKPEKKCSDNKYINESTLQLFFESAKNSRSSVYLHILLHTGMRVGELCALQWKDVDFEHKELHIYKTINRTTCYFDEYGEKLEEPIGSVQITTPKREKSNRVIPMAESVMEAFRTLKRTQDEDKQKNAEWGKTNPFLEEYPDLLLTTKRGNYFLPNYIEAECNRINKKVNTKLKKEAEKEKKPYQPIHIHPHMFRHTFVTNCYQQGVDSRILLDIVGHTHINMSNHYTHPEKEFMHHEFEKYDQQMITHKSEK